MLFFYDLKTYPLNTLLPTGMDRVKTNYFYMKWLENNNIF